MLGDTDWKRLFRPNGALHVWRDVSPSALDERIASLRMPRRVSFERLGAEQLRELEPALSPSYKRGIYFPDSGHVISPPALVAGLMDRAAALGASILSARVEAIVP
ncbi:FAD-dependent oxidoreductase [Bradyrhizobium sp. 187]|uniref:FAD-dependent oxidoreductase n=1 Tax=Bradyrhizobium sp. 187 TaxID=2782655 RepID=UPI001FFE3884|nr:FAD-dependent oxidoreductase [Bradyrhizobium sp. 187]